MSVTTVESLNKDVLMEIFEFLDASNLKTCSLVCKRWDDLISTSISTMRKLPLSFGKLWKDKAAEAKSITRHHHTLVLEHFKYEDPELVEIISKLGRNVRVLHLNRIKIIDNSFPKLLDALPMLEKINFRNCDVDVKFDVKFEIKNLKTLVVIGFGLDILDRISEIQVQTLKIATIKPTEANINSFVRILSMQKGPTELALKINREHSNASFNEIFSADRSIIKALEAVKLNLKKFSLDFLDFGVIRTFDKSFIKFLKAHQSTLEDLEIQNDLGEKIFKVLMKDLRLKRLILTDVWDKKFNSISPNHHLKTLQINRSFGPLETALGLFRVYSSVEKLVIKRWEKEIAADVIVSILNNQKCLGHLEIPSLPENTPELAIPSLKTFHVNDLALINPWQTFLVNNPSLENIVAKNVYDTITYESLDAITQRLPQLKHIKLRGNFKPNQGMLEMLHRNCPQLHLLEVYKYDAKNTNTNIGKLKLIFYHDDPFGSAFKAEPTMWSGEGEGIDLEKDIYDEDYFDEDDLNFEYTDRSD